MLLCLNATLSGDDLEAAKQVLHSHSWRLARDAGSDLQLRLAATRYRMRVDREIQSAVKIAAEEAGGGCEVQLSDW